MAKSWNLASHNFTPDSFGTAQSYISFGMDTEGDSASQCLAPIAACTINTPRMRVTNNITTGTGKLILQKNGVDTAVEISVDSADGSGWIDGTGSVAWADDDTTRWRWDGGVTAGSIDLHQISVVIEADGAGDAITFFNVNSNGSSNLSTFPSTRYHKPHGERNWQTTEADGQTEMLCGGTMSHMYLTSGTVTFTGNATVTSRVNGLDGNMTFTFDQNHDQTMSSDDVNTDTISDGDLFAIEVENPSTGTANNVEKSGATLTNASGQFMSYCAHGSSRANLEDGWVRYFPIGGNLAWSAATTESDVQWTVPFDCTIKEIYAEVNEIVMTDDSTLRVRKDGVNVGTALTITSAGGTGHKKQTQTSLDFDQGDLINFRIDMGATGTRIKFGVLGLLAEERNWDITDVDGDESVYDTQTGVAVTLSGTVSASGKRVFIEQGSSSVEQSVTAEDASSATITVDYGGVLTPGAATLYVWNPV
jgi:hypothetical protein